MYGQISVFLWRSFHRTKGVFFYKKVLYIFVINASYTKYFEFKKIPIGQNIGKITSVLIDVFPTH